MRSRMLVLATVLAMLALPTAARADWLASPFVGPSFGVDTDFVNVGSLLNEGTTLTFGGSFGYLAPGGLGLEVDFGHTPSFFEGNSILDPFVDSHVTTVMANAIVGGPRRGSSGIRPYGSGGVGLIQSRISDGLGIVGLDSNQLGVNAGGGIMGFFSDQIGVRADIRYFRAVGEDDELGIVTDDLSFWRSTVGVSFRF